MTQPLKPIAEAYVGTNNPYRGIEQHGVESDNRPQSVPGYGDTVQIEYAEPVPMQDPVPVIIVNEAPREQRDWAVSTFTVTDRLMQVMGQDDTRTNLMIVNSGPNTVYIAAEPQTNTTLMFPVASGGTFSLDAETEVWGICAATESGALRIVREFRRSMSG